MLVRVVALILILSLLACGSTSAASDSSGRMIKRFVDLPNWDVDGMAQQADAVIIGTLTREMGTKREIAHSFDNEVRLFSIFKDYEVEIERFIYPIDAPSPQIAIITEAGYASDDETVQVVDSEPEPDFKSV
jgi:hypothetical protein